MTGIVLEASSRYRNVALWADRRLKRIVEPLHNCTTKRAAQEGMSGAEICKQSRAAKVKTPIIVRSALGDEVDKVLLLEIGAGFGRCSAGRRR